MHARNVVGTQARAGAKTLCMHRYGWVLDQYYWCYPNKRKVDFFLVWASHFFSGGYAVCRVCKQMVGAGDVASVCSWFNVPCCCVLLAFGGVALSWKCCRCGVLCCDVFGGPAPDSQLHFRKGCTALREKLNDFNWEGAHACTCKHVKEGERKLSCVRQQLQLCTWHV